VKWYGNAANETSVGPLTVCGRDIARAAGYSPLELEHVGLTHDEAHPLTLTRPLARYACSPR
jgi:hypothetical protein